MALMYQTSFSAMYHLSFFAMYQMSFFLICTKCLFFPYVPNVCFSLMYQMSVFYVPKVRLYVQKVFFYVLFVSLLQGALLLKKNIEMLFRKHKKGPSGVFAF